MGWMSAFIAKLPLGHCNSGGTTGSVVTVLSLYSEVLVEL